MSFDHRKSSVFVDTGLLRDHVSELREEKKTATRLRDNIRAMKNYSDPSSFGQYASILREIDQLIEYFDRIIKVLSNAEDDAVHLSRVIGDLIEEDTDKVLHTTSNAFML